MSDRGGRWHGWLPNYDPMGMLYLDPFQAVGKIRVVPDAFRMMASQLTSTCVTESTALTLEQLT